MKKRLFIYLLVICFAQLISVLAVGAEEAPTKIKYGEKAEIDLKLAESFDTTDTDNLSVWPGGEISLNDKGELEFTTVSGTFVDVYDIPSDSLKNDASIQKGAKYFVVSFQNNSDGSVWFCFQPEKNDEAEHHLYLSGEMDESVIWVNKNGVAEKLEPSDSAAISARTGFEVPDQASGYLFIPVSIITSLGNWSTSEFSGDPEIKSVGFHIAISDASYVEFTISDLYVCGELPEYAAPEATPTEAPTSTPEVTPTTGITDAPSKAPESSATKAPSSDITPDSSSSGQKENTSNTGVIIAIIAVAAVVVIGVTVFITVKKKK